MAMFMLGLMVMLDVMKSVIPAERAGGETGPGCRNVGNRQNLIADFSGSDDSEDALTMGL